MTNIADASAEACPSFSAYVLSHDYDVGDFTCAGTNCDVVVDLTKSLGTYTVTYRVEVPSESWSFDWMF